MMQQTNDPTLKILIELAVTSLDTDAPVFPTLMETPVLWRKFLYAVQVAREDARKAKEVLDKNIPDLPKQ
ncbi:MAG: hypothetical protein ACWGQW_03570 [bacterium]